MTPGIPRYKSIDLAWLIFMLVAGSTISILLAPAVFDFTVLISGLLCVGLIAIGRREGYIFGLYNSLAYSVLAYSNLLYGEIYLNLFFFVPTGILGYLMWRAHLTQNRTVAMRKLSARSRWLTIFLCAIATLALGLLLRLNPNQNTPYIDALTNVLSVVATFLMMWRYKEQWALYILLNIATIAMWVIRYLHGGDASDQMILMWSLFLINGVFGAWRWHIGAKIPSLKPDVQALAPGEPA